MPPFRTEAQALEMTRKYSFRDGHLDFNLYTLRGGAPVEALPYIPQSPGTDWKATTRAWFLETRGVPVLTDKPAPPTARPARPGESVRVLETSPRSDRIVLQADAAEDIPILVKTGYFPTWRATDRTGPLEVRRATPNLMVVYGHGKIELEYRRPWEELFGLVLCCIGLALVVFVRR
jgi:hypothetical protein